jgi:hypothetical protein
MFFWQSQRGAIRNLSLFYSIELLQSFPSCTITHLTRSIQPSKIAVNSATRVASRNSRTTNNNSSAVLPDYRNLRALYGMRMSVPTNSDLSKGNLFGRFSAFPSLVLILGWYDRCLTFLNSLGRSTFSATASSILHS